MDSVLGKRVGADGGEKSVCCVTWAKAKDGDAALSWGDNSVGLMADVIPGRVWLVPG